MARAGLERQLRIRHTFSIVCLGLAPLWAESSPDAIPKTPQTQAPATATSASPSFPKLSHSDPAVRRNTAIRLGAEQNKAAVPTLLRALQDKDEQVRRAVVTALGQIQDQRAADGLIKTLQSDKSVHARRDAVEALGLLKAPESVPALVQAAGDPYLPLRITSLKALAAMDAAEAKALVLKALTDEADGVRMTAVRVAGEKGYPEASEGLKNNLQFPNVEIRLETLKALEQWDQSANSKSWQKDFLPVLKALSASDPDTRVRESAAKLLGQWK